MFGSQFSTEARVMDVFMENKTHSRGFLARKEQLPLIDMFQACFQLCRHLSDGMDVVFSPQLPDPTENVVQSYLSQFSIPHLTPFSRTSNPNTLRIVPPIGQAVVDLVKYLGWSQTRILYEFDEDLEMLNEHFNANFGERMTALMKQVRSWQSIQALFAKLKRAEETRFIVIASIPKTLAILRAAEELQMLSLGYHYILANLRLPCAKIYFTYTGQVNLTCLQLVQPDVAELRQFTVDHNLPPLQSALSVKNFSSYNNNATSAFDLAIAMDAVKILRELHDISREGVALWKPSAKSDTASASRPPKCMDITVPHTRGRILRQYFEKLSVPGFSGNIQFDSRGFRRNYTIDIVHISRLAVMKVDGLWNDTQGLHIFSEAKEVEAVTEFQDKPVEVVTILSAPFTMLKKGRNPEEGIDAFEGFCVDLMREIALLTDMTYSIHLVRDGKYGGQMANGSWNGMIGELIDGTADLALAPLTITSERQRVVDFTKPYMDVGVSIMMKRSSAATSSFSFLRPLETDIWMCIIFSCLSVSVVLFIVSRISLIAWMKPSDGRESLGSPSSDYQFTLSNCFFLMLGAVLQRGEDICDKTSPISSRLVGGGWWFFTLIMISSYTANLAAFLTVDRMKTPITGAEDLASQTNIAYGSLDSGSTKAFFKNSALGTYQRMYVYMEDKRTFLESTEAGVETVRESSGDFAFLLESTMNDYFNQRKPCNTMKVGTNLNTKNYGIATPQGSALLEELTVAILELNERGFMAEKFNYWWYEQGQCSRQSGQTKSTNANALEMGNVMGIFYILIGGVALGLVVCFFEFVFVSIRQARLIGANASDVLWLNFKYCVSSMFSASVPIRGIPLRRRSSISVGLVEGSRPSLRRTGIFPRRSQSEETSGKYGRQRTPVGADSSLGGCIASSADLNESASLLSGIAVRSRYVNPASNPGSDSFADCGTNLPPLFDVTFKASESTQLGRFSNISRGKAFSDGSRLMSNPQSTSWGVQPSNFSSALSSAYLRSQKHHTEV